MSNLRFSKRPFPSSLSGVCRWFVVTACGLVWVFALGNSRISASCGDWLDHAAVHAVGQPLGAASVTKSPLTKPFGEYVKDVVETNPSVSYLSLPPACDGPACGHSPGWPSQPPVSPGPSSNVKYELIRLSAEAFPSPSRTFGGWVLSMDYPFSGYPIRIDRPPCPVIL